MDAVTFVSSEPRRFAIPNSTYVPLVKVKNALYVDGIDQPVMATNKLKLVAFNCKKPKELRFLDRVDGGFADVPLSFSVRFLGFLSPDKNTVYAAGETTVATITPERNPSGEMFIASQKDFDLKEEIKAVAPREGEAGVAVLTALGNLLVLAADGKGIEKRIGLKGPLGSHLLSVHKESGFAVVSGRNSQVDIISLSSEKSVMQKAWVPHGEDVPTAVHILQTTKYGAKCIVTASQNNTELRFWTLSESNVITLVQQLSITGDADTPNTPRQFFFTSTEDYILLPASDGSSIVVVELDRQTFKASRGTDWASPNASSGNRPYLCGSAFIRKVLDGPTVTFELTVIARSDERVSMVQFDNSKLMGASNLFNAGERAASDEAAPRTTREASDVTKWFGTPKDSSTPSVSASSNNVPAIASVSSTINGQRGVSSIDVSFVQTQAVNALRTQGSAFRDGMSTLDSQVVSIQKQASAVMKSLQEMQLKDEAQAAGRDFATRNKGRLMQQQQSSAQASGPSSQVRDTLTNYVASLPDTVSEAVRSSLKVLLGKCIDNAVDKSLSQIDQKDWALPKMSSTDSMQQFSNAIDKVHQSQNKALKLEAEKLESLTVKQVASAMERGNKVLLNSKAFLSGVQAELKLLRTDIDEAKVAVVNSRKTTGFSAPVADSAEILKQALQQAAAGAWSDAVITITQTSDIKIVMGFLESEAVTAKKDLLCDPATLPLPVMLTLVRQVADDVKSTPGNVAFRTAWVADFLGGDWHETLVSMKSGKDAAQAKLLTSCLDQFDAITESFAAVDKNSIDVSTRFNIKLVNKIVRQLFDTA